MQFKGEKLRKLRLEKKLSMLDLEELTGINQSTLSDIENNKKNPRQATVDRLCQGLKVKEEYFYLDDSRLLTDILSDLPDYLKEFIAKSDNAPYLIFSEKAYREGIPTEILDQILTLVISSNKEKK